MSKPNLKSQAKRKRELAKLGKRQAKDEKRALRKAERLEPVVADVAALKAPAPAAAAYKAVPPGPRAVTPAAALPKKPLTLAEAALRWKTSKVAPASTRIAQAPKVRR